MSKPGSSSDWQQTWRDYKPKRAVSRDSRIRRAVRAVLIEQIAAVAVPILSVVLILTGLAHASSRAEQILGILAIAGTLLTWVAFVVSRRRERQMLAAASPAFVHAALRRRRDDRRLAATIWGTIVCGLLFLIPWWSGGVRIHEGAPFAPVVMWSAWMPIAMIVALAGWSTRMWRRAGREIPVLQKAIEAFTNGHSRTAS